MSGGLFLISAIAFCAALILGLVGLVRMSGRPKPDTRLWYKRTRWYAIGALGVWAFTLILAVAIPSTPSAPDEALERADSSADKYTQTWTQDYSETTCTDWNEAMTDQQQFAAAADILVAAWRKIEGSSEFPSDALIREFQDGVTTVCVEPTMTITDATAALYLTEPRFEP